MKPLDPCRSCKGISSVIILTRDWDAAAWGALPPGAVGAVYCAGCGAWRKWPSRADLIGERGTTQDKLPRPVVATLRTRVAERAGVDVPTARDGGLQRRLL